MTKQELKELLTPEFLSTLQSIIKRPYDPFDNAIFFHNINQPSND